MEYVRHSPRRLLRENLRPVRRALQGLQPGLGFGQLGQRALGPGPGQSRTGQGLLAVIRRRARCSRVFLMRTNRTGWRHLFITTARAGSGNLLRSRPGLAVFLVKLLGLPSWAPGATLALFGIFLLARLLPA